MMHIDINSLSESDLIDLNRRVVERLRMLRDLKAHCTMMDFRIGEKVTFHPEGREPIVGTLTKYNRKSVTVIAESGQPWTVAPAFLRRVKDVGGAGMGASASPEGSQLSLVRG